VAATSRKPCIERASCGSNRQTGQRVDEFSEALLNRIANADISVDRAVLVLARCHGLRHCRSKMLATSPTARAISLRHLGLPSFSGETPHDTGVLENQIEVFPFILN
jgi:hypothetical protein